MIDKRLLFCDHTLNGGNIICSGCGGNSVDDDVGNDFRAMLLLILTRNLNDPGD
jgi:hypothetical protein